jgi:hypothetical protein
VAKSMALTRADEKPRARDIETPLPTFIVRPPAAGDRAGRVADLPGAGVPERPLGGEVQPVGERAAADLHRPTAPGRRLTRLGDLLGTIPAGPRPAGPGSEEA